MKELHGTDLQHVQNGLSSLRGVYGLTVPATVPAIVQGLPCAGKADRENQLQFEPGPAGMMRQRSVVVPARPMVWPSNPIRTG